MKDGFVFLLLFLLTGQAIHGQEYPYRHFTMGDGLVHSTVYRIYQDKRGFLWFSTDYGASMFNGKTFKNYTEENGLSYKCVLSTSEDERGNILACTYKGGVTIINDTSVKPWTIAHGSIPRQMIYTLPYKDKVWLVALDDGGAKAFLVWHDTIYRKPISYEHTDISALKLYRFDDEIIFTTNKGVYKVYNDTAIKPYLSASTAGLKIDDIKKDKKGGYWVGMENRLMYVYKDSILRSYDYKGATEDILVDRNNTAWVATESGDVFLVDDKGIRNIITQLKIARRLVLTDLFEDSEGNIWMGTQGQGVFRLNSLDIYNYPAENNKINNYCNAITPVSNDEIWTGSFGTISSWKNDELKAIPSSLKPSEFIYFMKKAGDRMLIGVPSRIISKQIMPPYTETDINKDVFGAISFCTGRDGNIVLSSFRNLYNFNNNKLSVFDSSGFLNNTRCNFIQYDAEGRLWISTDSIAVTYKNGRYDYPTVPGYGHPFKPGRMLLDYKNRMWFSTAYGLVCKDGNSYKIFTKKDGLIANMCRELYEDDAHNLWVSTFNGINIVDLNTLNIREFVVDMAMPEIISLYRLRNKLFIGTIEGLSVVNITPGQNKEFIPPLYITSVKTASGQYNMPGKISLPYNDNKLQIEFAGLSFRYPERVEYRYKIEHIDDTWQLTRNNTVELSSLPPGHYKFVVNARLINGTWSKDVVLPIVVATPFWRTWWFISLAVILAVALIYFLLKWRITATEARKRRQLHTINKIIYLKQQALSALINPHFIFNCMNSIQHYLHKQDHELANIYLSDFASLIRMTMQNAQEVFIDLQKEIERLKLYLGLERLRIGEENLAYEIIVDQRLDTYEVRIPNMILQPYIENAIWHGIMPKNGQGKIWIRFEMIDEKNLKISIQDDGVGIKKTTDKNPAHKSLGMKLTETRLELLHKLLDEYYKVSVHPVIDADGKTTGTIVEIFLPYKPDEKDIQLLEAESLKNE